MVGLVNSSGKLVVEYVYDPWGKLLETKIGVAETDSKIILKLMLWTKFF